MVLERGAFSPAATWIIRTTTVMVAMLLLFSSFSSTHSVVFATDPKKYIPLKECGLYLAPSSIPGAGLGMYSGSKQYRVDELVSDSDLMIPNWDLDYHNGGEQYYHL